MLVKLKTLKQLEKEFKPYCSKWDIINWSWSNIKSIDVKYFDLGWYFGVEKIKKLGTVVEVEKQIQIIERSNVKRNYTHKIKNSSLLLHELWFEQEGFIKEEEFMV